MLAQDLYAAYQRSHLVRGIRILIVTNALHRTMRLLNDQATKQHHRRINDLWG